jgi:hypothetical protein
MNMKTEKPTENEIFNLSVTDIIILAVLLFLFVLLYSVLFERPPQPDPPPICRVQPDVCFGSSHYPPPGPGKPDDGKKKSLSK